MKFSRQIMSIVAVGALLAACNQFKSQKTESGLKYQFFTQNEAGKKAKLGDLITFDFKIQNSSDSTLQTTFGSGNPIKMPLQKGTFKGAFEEGLAMLTAGDSAVFFVSADSLFRAAQQPLPQAVKAGSDLKFTVKMISVQTMEEFNNATIQKQKDEPKVIADFVAKNFPTATKTASGMAFVIKKEGTGAVITAGDVVKVNYTGKLLSGKTFDTSVGREPYELMAGAGGVIKGWDETLLMMKQGEQRTVIIPSELAYGPQGSQGAIEPYTPLMFDMEIVSVTKGAKKK
jgi:FKBP-type peptidyl-prolyl cis-trans isomerase FkpA